MHPRMMNLPPLGPLATSGAPLSSTIVTIGAPAVMAAALVLGLLVVLGVVILWARRDGRRTAARARTPVPNVVMLYAATGRDR
jgi:hypothetical protein